jgi:hypothetical protein
VINRPPVYDVEGHTYASVTVHLNYELDVIIPSFHDPEGDLAFAAILETATYPVPFTLLPDFTKVTFSPVAFNLVGVHNVYVKLYDNEGAFSQLPIQVTVMNCVPIFTTIPLPT